jgi:hypothetical protein
MKSTCFRLMFPSQLPVRAAGEAATGPAGLDPREEKVGLMTTWNLLVFSNGPIA